MADEPKIPTLELAERVALTAREHGIETAVIGALALAAHGYIRATTDVDLASAVDIYPNLRDLADALRAQGLFVTLRAPDESDDLGGVVKVWQHEDAEGDPVEPVEVVNFRNPHKPRLTPAPGAIRRAATLDDRSPLRFVELADLVAFKLDAGSRADLADIVALLRHNPDANLDVLRERAAPFDSKGVLETLIAEAAAG